MKIERNIVEANYTLSEITQEEFTKLRDSLTSLIHFHTYREKLADPRNPLIEAPQWLLKLLTDLESK